MRRSGQIRLSTINEDAADLKATIDQSIKEDSKILSELKINNLSSFNE